MVYDSSIVSTNNYLYQKVMQNAIETTISTVSVMHAVQNLFIVSTQFLSTFLYTFYVCAESVFVMNISNSMIRSIMGKYGHMSNCK